MGRRWCLRSLGEREEREARRNGGETEEKRRRNGGETEVKLAVWPTRGQFQIRRWTAKLAITRQPEGDDPCTSIVRKCEDRHPGITSRISRRRTPASAPASPHVPRSRSLAACPRSSPPIKFHHARAFCSGPDFSSAEVRFERHCGRTDPWIKEIEHAVARSMPPYFLLIDD